jgi:hypothetical protein
MNYNNGGDDRLEVNGLEGRDTVLGRNAAAFQGIGKTSSRRKA